MAKDPTIEVLKTRIVAELLGDTINTFVNKLDWKSIAVFLILILM